MSLVSVTKGKKKHSDSDGDGGDYVDNLITASIV